MRVSWRSTCLAVLMGLSPGLLGTPALATPSVVALTPLPAAAQRLTAYGGYVVFSQRSGQDRWSLMAWHDGSVSPLPVPARAIPFDAEAGPGPAGTPVVVFSKCARDPRERPGPGPKRPADVEWQTGFACRIYELSLQGGAPRRVAALRPPAGASDSTPAIWRGEIAFARYVRSGPPQLLLAGAGMPLRRLGGGPASCPAPSTVPEAPLCARRQRLGRRRIAGISLGPSAAAYEWVADVPGAVVGPLADPEIRVDPLRDRRQVAPTKLVAMAFASGACGAESSVSPNAAGARVLYLTTRFTCEPGPERLTSTFHLRLPGRPGTSSGTGGHRLALALASDRGTAYWIGDVPQPQPQAEGGAGCPQQSVCSSAAPLAEPAGCEAQEGTCTLMRTSGLAVATAAGAAIPRQRRGGGS